MIERPIALGLAISAVMALLARKYRALTIGGLIAALAIAAALLASSWENFTLMVLFFSSSSMLTYVGYGEKRRRGAAEREGGRSFSQVACSGGIPAFLSMLLAAPNVSGELHSAVVLAVAATIAFANSDTWAVEIGALSKRSPRLITNPRVRVPHGVSGGVTLRGELGAAMGAALIAGSSALLLAASKALGGAWSTLNVNPLRLAGAVFALGWLGEVLDSLVGATLQVKYMCPKCGVLCDREVHVCGTRAVRAGGFKWVRNELVNLIVEIVVAALALSISRYL
ncbi:MAG: DUF92 domain-containing protein [Thermoprotei archaeon]|mgnify:CR=1 FL=1|nr:MAG: DUF92 domain-containing protein [Thermoprotei archaeon]